MCQTLLQIKRFGCIYHETNGWHKFQVYVSIIVWMYIVYTNMYNVHVHCTCMLSICSCYVLYVEYHQLWGAVSIRRWCQFNWGILSFHKSRYKDMPPTDVECRGLKRTTRKVCHVM